MKEPLFLLFSFTPYLLFNSLPAFAMADDCDFPSLLQQEKRVKYSSDIEALKATHYKLNKHEYYHHDRMHRAFLQRYNNGQDKRAETLLILAFTHSFKLSYYTYGSDGGYQEIVEKPLLVGYNANYNKGELTYPRDSIFTNMDTFFFEQTKHDEHHIFRRNSYWAKRCSAKH